MANGDDPHHLAMPDLIVPPPLPESIQFRPTQRECILFLLQKFIGKPLPCSHIFDSLDPYDPTHLPYLFLSVERHQHLYLFTKLSKKGKSSGRSDYKNANRTVSNDASWQGDQFHFVTDRKGARIGLVRTLHYQEEGSAYNHRYQMHEYSLLDNTRLRYNLLEDYVLCHFSRNDRWLNGKKVRVTKKKKYNNCSSSSSDVVVSDGSNRSSCTAHDQINQEAIVLPAPVELANEYEGLQFVQPLAALPPPPPPAAALPGHINHLAAPAASVLDYDGDQLEDFLLNEVNYGDQDVGDHGNSNGGGANESSWYNLQGDGILNQWSRLNALLVEERIHYTN